MPQQIAHRRIANKPKALPRKIVSLPKKDSGAENGPVRDKTQIRHIESGLTTQGSALPDDLAEIG
jgi:hypothetical protein